MADPEKGSVWSPTPPDEDKTIFRLIKRSLLSRTKRTSRPPLGQPVFPATTSRMLSRRMNSIDLNF